MNRIESIYDTSKIFITSGFLPIDDNLIKFYAKNYIEKYIDNEILNENEYYIFHLIKDMGYLFKKDEYLFEVTDKMINTLSNTKYATQLIILKNNYDDKVLLNKKYIKSIYEILKLINIKIFTLPSSRYKLDT